VQLFQNRLQKRGYPKKFIVKYTQKINFTNRNNYLQPQIKISPSYYRPIFKCIPPPKLRQLKQIILSSHKSINKIVNKPIFISMKYRTLHNILVRAKHIPTPDNLTNITEICTTNTTKPQITTWKGKASPQPQPYKCKQKICSTCQHYNTANHVRSTTTKQQFRINFLQL
jgi:hypothetical protein